MEWRILHIPETESTNKDAKNGCPGDVFWADAQTAGRGRLDHRWLSAPGENLTFSAVLDVSGMPPQEVSTLPLATGLSVLEAVRAAVPSRGWSVKWPNDILHGARKVCGILCERTGDAVVAGVGLNVNQRAFPEEIARRATSLAAVAGRPVPLADILHAVLERLAANFVDWKERGFAALWPRLAEADFLKGREVAVLQTDCDAAPLRGICGGIREDGTLDVGGARAYAGEAHVSLPPEPEEGA